MKHLKMPCVFNKDETEHRQKALFPVRAVLTGRFFCTNKKAAKAFLVHASIPPAVLWGKNPTCKSAKLQFYFEQTKGRRKYSLCMLQYRLPHSGGKSPTCKSAKLQFYFEQTKRLRRCSLGMFPCRLPYFGVKTRPLR